MDSFIEQTLAMRAKRTYREEDRLLIQKGGYVSPNPNLYDDILVALSLKKPILLKGPSGSGKTRLAQSISALFQQPMQSVNCSVDLDAEALLGFKTIVSQDGQSTIEFVDGPVVTAMKRGHLLYIDEINMAKPETLPILHSLLDHRRMLTNPFTSEVIVAHEDFSVLSAINEGYIGTSPMNEALKNRFVSFSIPYLQAEQLRTVLEQAVPEAEAPVIDTIMNLSEDLSKQAANGLLADEAASVRSLINALQLAVHMPVDRAVTYAIAELLEDKMERDLVNELTATWVK
ncbi:ATP-binding protein [Sporosarcina gallistercoris]|uniref:AAA family ATPase n=1 Tax=Sporosarcina gallistercoris TaxID=2762245 RepID=A0ABR8PJE9_9BACL|nr:AAA family ATPase [Sporosarcina gallistercoris]MBD7908315.1 AAA family ATPase [Sporosarcina gallistercoris]